MLKPLIQLEKHETLVRTGIFLAMVILLPTAALAQVFLPGTQPEESNIKVSKPGLCKTCHARTPNGKADPYFSWQSGMMAQAQRDPVYHAALTIANQDIPGVGEYCIRCHAPAGWLEGRSKSPDGSNLNRHDYNGVSCDVCHRLMDPNSAEAAKIVKDVPPGHGNAMMVADLGKVARGPYDDVPPVKSHKAIRSDFHSSSSLCGTCHDVSNPVYAEDVKKQPPYSYGTLERTFSEWSLSAYAKDGPQKKTCQACHFPQVQGGGRAARTKEAKHRDYFVEHGPVGSSTWVQDAVWQLSNKKDLSREALDYGKEKSLAMLKTAAQLRVSFPKKDIARVRITNLTGHKLPTGYIEGRRMWLNIRYYDADGTLLKEDGKYAAKETKLNGKAVRANTLLDPKSTVVYECLQGMTEAHAKKHGKKPGKSFHFVLNDYVVKDNRIPPKGFNNKSFARRLCQPVGKKYSDGQHWDDVDFKMPRRTEKVTVTLMFESVSWEYIKFLAENNTTDDTGMKLYNVWDKTGQCPPSTIATSTEPVR